MKLYKNNALISRSCILNYFTQPLLKLQHIIPYNTPSMLPSIRPSYKFWRTVLPALLTSTSYNMSESRTQHHREQWALREQSDCLGHGGYRFLGALHHRGRYFGSMPFLWFTKREVESSRCKHTTAWMTHFSREKETQSMYYNAATHPTVPSD